MSTIEDFENAPVGATAKKGVGLVAIREGYETAYLPWVCTTYGEWFSNEEMAEQGYTLERPVPTTAQEALDLAWDLAHEVKKGQTIPGGERTIGRYEDGDFFLGRSLTDRLVTESEQSHLRTLDPLPEPEPDWLNAPAVVAFVKGRVGDPQVFSRGNKTGTQWLLDTKVYRWDELIGVVPLYPKEDVEPGKSDTPNDAPRYRTVAFRDDTPWGTRLGGDPA